MLIQLGTNNKIFGGRIKKETVKSMVQYYRKQASSGTLFYAHFSVDEIIQLLVDNGAITKGALSHIIPDHGLKIYIGKHDDVTNCPIGRPDYMDKDTAILCTTFITDEKKFCYSDKLKNKKNYIAISGTRLGTDGDALDQSSTYPPDNPYAAIPPIPVPVGEDPDNFDVGL